MQSQKERDKFYRIYANLPLGAREEIVVVLDDEPMTWKAVKLELDNETDKGIEILGKLYDLQILNGQK